jgi:LDH2 family malate/lactate/ureidoglycolate dehydrogenase
VPGQPRIYTAGEKAHVNAQRVRDEGVELPRGVQAALASLRNELKVEHRDLGF